MMYDDDDDDDDVCMKIVDIIKKALIARFYINIEEQRWLYPPYLYRYHIMQYINPLEILSSSVAIIMIPIFIKQHQSLYIMIKQLYDQNVSLTTENKNEFQRNYLLHDIVIVMHVFDMMHKMTGQNMKQLLQLIVDGS